MNSEEYIKDIINNKGYGFKLFCIGEDFGNEKVWCGIIEDGKRKLLRTIQNKYKLKYLTLNSLTP